MSIRRILAFLLTASLPLACVLPTRVAEETATAGAAAQSLVQEFFRPASVERNLKATLTGPLGLEGVRVSHQGETIRVAFEMPDGLATAQSMLLFTAVLDLAARFAPFSEQVELTVLVGGEPFYALTTKTEAIAALRAGEKDLADILRDAELSLPPEADSPLAPAAAVPAIAEIDSADLITNIPILASALHVDPFGNWTIIGALGNDNEVLVSAVEVSYRVTDADGQVIHEGKEHMPQYRISPGTGSAFNIYVPYESGVPAGLELAVVQATYDPSDQEAPALEVINTRILPGEDGRSAVIAGELRNPHDQTVTMGTVTAIGLSQDGRALSTATHASTAWSLPPREAAPFSVVLDSMTPEDLAALNNTILFSDGWFTSPTDVNTLDLGESVRYFRAADGSSHLIGLAHNTGDRPWSGRLLGVLTDAEGNVLDVASGYLPGDPLAAGLMVTFEISDFRGQFNVIGENAARFEVIVDPSNVADEVAAQVTPLTAELVLVEPWADRMHVEAALAPFAAGFDELIVLVNIWSPETGLLLGTRASYFSPSETQGGAISADIPVDPANYDPATAVAEVVVYGVARSP